MAQVQTALAVARPAAEAAPTREQRLAEARGRSERKGRPKDKPLNKAKAKAEKVAASGRSRSGSSEETDPDQFSSMEDDSLLAHTSNDAAYQQRCAEEEAKRAQGMLDEFHPEAPEAAEPESPDGAPTKVEQAAVPSAEARASGPAASSEAEAIAASAAAQAEVAATTPALEELGSSVGASAPKVPVIQAATAGGAPCG